MGKSKRIFAFRSFLKTEMVLLMEILLEGERPGPFYPAQSTEDL